MSDDGPFIHRQSSPKYHVPKIYVATTHEAVTDELVANLLSGVQLNDEPAPLAAVSCRKVGDYQIEIVLAEGKYHQVKRMLVAAGNHCVALQRAQIGKLKLTDLKLAEGGWCYLSAAELALLTAV
jgi:16S rRNA pseudouridine516 synthase